MQSDKVYLAKKKAVSGARLHYFIVIATFFAVSFPYLIYLNCWLLIILIGFLHIAQDEVKLRFNIPQESNFLMFILDQGLHIAYLLLVFLLPFANQPPKLPEYVSLIYNNDVIVIISIAYIASSFTGAYLWEAFKISYFKKKEKSNKFLKHYLKTYGMFERFIITTACLNFYFLPLLILPILCRLFLKKISFSGDFIFNFLYASTLGLLALKFI